MDESAAEGHSAELLLPEEGHFDLVSNSLSPRVIGNSSIGPGKLYCKTSRLAFN